MTANTTRTVSSDSRYKFFENYYACKATSDFIDQNKKMPKIKYTTLRNANQDFRNFKLHITSVGNSTELKVVEEVASSTASGNYTTSKFITVDKKVISDFKIGQDVLFNGHRYIK